MNLEEHLIEQLSEEVHNAWMKEKLDQGFHAPIDCDHYRVVEKQMDVSNNSKNMITVPGCFEKYCDKCHTDLYPYPALPENIKEYDRVTVRAVLDALTKLGWFIRRD